jgi:hypothetical protein
LEDRLESFAALISLLFARRLNERAMAISALSGEVHLGARPMTSHRCGQQQRTSMLCRIEGKSGTATSKAGIAVRPWQCR